MRGRGAASSVNRHGGRIQLFLFAPHQHHLGAMLSEPLRHPLPDAAASTGDEGGLSGQNILAKNRHL